MEASSVIENDSMFPAETVTIRSIRVNPPGHYTLKIDSFSLLSNTVIDYQSGEFEAGGHRWILSLYPSGDKERDGEGYISLYLLYAEIHKLSLGFEVNVIFKFFLYNQILDKYLTIQDSEGRVRRFHKTRTEHGFSQLISLAHFNNASNGYLVDDSCEFGVEVFVLENTSKGGHLTLLKLPDDDWHFTWTISNFSTLGKARYFSEEFQGGATKWKLEVHPKGHLTEMENYLAFLIGFADYMNDEPAKSNSICSKFMRIFKRYTTPKESRRRMFVETKFRVVDQLHDKHVDRTDRRWFKASSYLGGFMAFMLLSDLHDPTQGFLVDDTLIVQVKFNVIYAMKELS